MAEKKSPVISFKDFSFQYRAQKKSYTDWNQSGIFIQVKSADRGTFRKWKKYPGRMYQRTESFFKSGRM